MISNYFGLFASFSTIFCCVLPSIFVLLGAGSVFASLTTNIPQLIWVAQHKVYFMLFALCMITLNTYLLFIKPQACPMDKNLAFACKKTKKVSKIIYFASVIILGSSSFMSYIWPYFS